MCVYKITHRESGKSYIGQTRKKARTRWTSHLRESKSIKPTYIGRVLGKYGYESFDFSVLDIAETLEQLDHKEQFYIDLYNTLSPNGYNLHSGGTNHYFISDETRQKMKIIAKIVGRNPAMILGLKKYTDSRRGVPLSESTREKMSKSHSGKVLTAEHRANISKSGKGRSPSEETRKKLSKSKMGHTHTDATREKLSKSHSGKVLSEEHRLKISIGGKGRVLTQETRDKMSIAKTGKKLSPEDKATWAKKRLEKLNKGIEHECI